MSTDSLLTNVSLFIIKAQRRKPGKKESCQRRRAQQAYKNLMLGPTPGVKIRKRFSTLWIRFAKCYCWMSQLWGWRPRGGRNIAEVIKINMALRIAHCGYMLDNGKLVMEGLSSELRNNEKVKKAYIGAGGRERRVSKPIYQETFSLIQTKCK